MAPDRTDESTKTHANGVPRRGRPRVLALWEGGYASADLPTNGRLVFGRALDCDLCIDDESVSRHHAALHVGNEIALEDLGSLERHAGGGSDARSGHATCCGVARSHRARQRAAPPRGAGARRGGRDGDCGGGATTVVRDPAMVDVYRLIDHVAASELCVLIVGETGVGKELRRRGAASTVASRCRPLRADQLRQRSGSAARERALRLRARCIHGRRDGEVGPVGGRRRRHRASRRGR